MVGYEDYKEIGFWGNYTFIAPIMDAIEDDVRVSRNIMAISLEKETYSKTYWLKVVIVDDVVVFLKITKKIAKKVVTAAGGRWVD